MALIKHLAITGFGLAGLLLSLFTFELCAQPKLELKEGDVWVTGIDPEVLYTFSRYFNSQKDWETVFPVTLKESISGIVIRGTYLILHDAVRFTPRFPFAMNVTYHASFFANELAANRNEVYLPSMDESILNLDFTIPSSDQTVPELLAIYPSANALPENLLKFHIRFSKSMTVGEAYQKVKLLDADGNEIEKAFLILDQELWDSDMKVLTLLLDPGRIKRGLRPNLEMKPPLHEGKKYSLVVKRGWEDIGGNTTQLDVVKTFACIGADRSSPAVQEFSIIAPTSLTASVIVQLHENIDYVLLEQALIVKDSSGEVVPGASHVRNNETVIEFVPKNPWSGSNYTIEFNPLIEDLAGNNLNRLFDSDLNSAKRSERPPTTLSFQVPSGSAQ